MIGEKALMDVPKPELKNKAAKEILGSASEAVYQILKNISKKVEEGIDYGESYYRAP